MTSAKPRPPLIPGEIRAYPVLPLRDTVVFPHVIAALFVGRKKSILALEEAMRNALGVIVGAEFRVPWHRRARAAVEETFRVLRVFLAFLVFLGLFVAAVRVIVWVVVLAWGLLPV